VPPPVCLWADGRGGDYGRFGRFVVVGFLFYIIWFLVVVSMMVSLLEYAFGLMSLHR